MWFSLPCVEDYTHHPQSTTPCDSLCLADDYTYDQQSVIYDSWRLAGTTNLLDLIGTKPFRFVNIDHIHHSPCLSAFVSISAALAVCWFPVWNRLECGGGLHLHNGVTESLSWLGEVMWLHTVDPSRHAWGICSTCPFAVIMPRHSWPTGYRAVAYNQLWMIDSLTNRLVAKEREPFISLLVSVSNT